MQVVIDIDEITYKLLSYSLLNGTLNTWEETIAKGKLLPKKHGRLIDADELIRNYGNPDIELLINIMPTILEANEE